MSGDTTERIRRHLIGLKMPRALEALQMTLSRIEQGELSALEAIESLLGEEYTTRESRRIKMALQTARLPTVKTLSGYDFSFQLREGRGASAGAGSGESQSARTRFGRCSHRPRPTHASHGYAQQQVWARSCPARHCGGHQRTARVGHAAGAENAAVHNAAC